MAHESNNLGEHSAKNSHSETSLLAADTTDATLTRALRATSDGKLQVTLSQSGGGGEIIGVLLGTEGDPVIQFDEIFAVADTGSYVTIGSLAAVPLLKDRLINHVSVSGENIAEYECRIDGVTIIRRRTNPTELNSDFAFQASGGGKGILVVVGEVFSVHVKNQGGSVADFNAHIGGVDYDVVV